MRIIESKVYQFDELTDGAKQKAIEKYRDSNNEFDWLVSEANNSFEKFADLFNIDWRQIDYNEPYRNEYSLKFDEDVLNLSGLRLAKYIWNNYESFLFKGKYYSVTSDKKVNHKRVKSTNLKNGKIFNAYYSAIQKENSCVLTGVCYDDDLLQPIYDFLKKPKDNVDLETLLNDCINSLCHSVSSEIEWRQEDEQIIEEIEANEYEFNEDGSLS